MRWYWIDRFLEFESGRYATAVKNISLAEDYLCDHFPYCPIFPKSLVIEGCAQTGGLLVYDRGGFCHKVVLAKVPRADFYFEVYPGDQLIYTARIEDFKKDGAMVTATSHCRGELHAKMEIFFAHLNDPRLGSLFDPVTFYNMMRTLRAFEVGRAADGTPLRPPAALLAGLSGQEANRSNGSLV